MASEKLSLSRSNPLRPIAGEGNITLPLDRWGNGGKGALEELAPIVYNELRKAARRQMMRERSGHTLESTAVVHEGYMRLVDQDHPRFQNRAHFFAVAAEMARRILVNYCKPRNAKKRGGPKVPLDLAPEPFEKQDAEVIALHYALDELAKLNARQAKIVAPSLKRDRMVARAFLQRSLSGNPIGKKI